MRPCKKSEACFYTRVSVLYHTTLQRQRLASPIYLVVKIPWCKWHFLLLNRWVDDFKEVQPVQTFLLIKPGRDKKIWGAVTHHGSVQHVDSTDCFYTMKSFQHACSRQKAETVSQLCFHQVLALTLARYSSERQVNVFRVEYKARDCLLCWWCHAESYGRLSASTPSTSRCQRKLINV